MNDWAESNNLNFLRSLAVVLVVACHISVFYGAEKTFGVLGPMGVMLFFVHTAFVLMQSLGRQADQERLFVPFIIRRWFRIYPLAIFAVLAAVLSHSPQWSVTTGHVYGTKLSSLDLLDNVALIQGSFVPLVPSIVGPMWSLPFEVQMYLLLPAVYVFVRGSSGLKKILLLWLAAALIGTAANHYIAVRTLFIYAPCFLSGVLAYKLAERVRPRVESVYWPVLLLAMTVAVTGLPIFGGAVKLWWVVCFLVGCALPFFKEISFPAVVKAARVVARYSYGVYLSHLFCMGVALERMHQYPLAARASVLALLLVLIPVVLYHVIERPFIELGRRLAGGMWYKCGTAVVVSE